MHKASVDISEDYRDFLFEVYGDRYYDVLEKKKEFRRQQKLARIAITNARKERKERKEDTDGTY